MNLGLFQLYLEGGLDFSMGELDVDRDYDPSDNVPPEKWHAAEGKVLWDRRLETVQGSTVPLWPERRGNYFDDGHGVTTLPLGLNDPCTSNEGWELPFSNYYRGLAGCELAGTSGLWQVDQDLSDGDQSSNGYFVAPWYAPEKFGTLARWRMDDDRAFSLKDEVQMHLGVAAAGGIDAVLLKLQLKAQMGVRVASGVITTFREELDLIDRNEAGVMPPPSVAGSDIMAQTNVSITPIGYNHVSLNPLRLSLNFALWTPFGTLEWNPTIFKLKDLTLEGDDLIAVEGDRMRVGGFSERPAQGGGRSTYSHLPKSAFPGESSSFAAINESVAQCLADPTESGNDAQPIPVGAPETEPLPYGLCFYGPYTAGLNGFLAGFGLGSIPLPPGQFSIDHIKDDVCENPDAYTNQFMSWPQSQCVSHAISYLCGQENGTEDVSEVKLHNGGPAIAHLVQEHKGEEAIVEALYEECALAFAASAPNKLVAKAMGEYLVQNFMHVHVCDKDTLEPVGEDVDADPDDGGAGGGGGEDGGWDVELDPCFLDVEAGTCSETCDPEVTSCGPEIVLAGPCDIEQPETCTCTNGLAIFECPDEPFEVCAIDPAGNCGPESLCRLSSRGECHQIDP